HGERIVFSRAGGGCSDRTHVWRRGGCRSGRESCGSNQLRILAEPFWRREVGGGRKNSDWQDQLQRDRRHSAWIFWPFGGRCAGCVRAADDAIGNRAGTRLADSGKKSG